MRAAVLHGVRDLRVEEVDDPTVQEPTDAVVRVTAAGICGSDLHPYRGRFGPPEPGRRPGHEFLGIVEEVGSAVELIEPGALVLAPFVFSDGTCAHCERGEHTSCIRGGFFGGPRTPGGQAEAVRVPLADGTLWPVPDELTATERRATVLLLGDVMGTGEHATRLAGVSAGDRVVIIGDGAVGLCAAIAARRRGPSRVVLVGHHPDRMELARRLGADATVDGRDVHVADEVVGSLGGMADCALETVGGTGDALLLAAALIRDYGRVGSVGVFGSGIGLPASEVFERNLRFAAGVAPTRAYVDELADLVTRGELDPSPVFTHTVPLEGTPDGYRMMDEREALKVLVDVEGTR